MRTLYFCPMVLLFLSFFLVFFLAYSQPSQIGCLPYLHTWCGLSANLGSRSETCSTRLAENTGRKKSPFWHHRRTLSGYVFEIKACVDNRKKLVKQQYLIHVMSSQYNGELRPTNWAEICWRVWDTPANFNGFRGTALSRRQPNFAALKRGRHLYSTGQPSRWALAHISGIIYFHGFMTGLFLLSISVFTARAMLARSWES